MKELVAGVTRLQRRLDYIAAKLSGQTPGDWEASVRMVRGAGVQGRGARQGVLADSGGLHGPLQPKAPRNLTQHAHCSGP